VDYLDVFNESVDTYTNLTIEAGTRVDQNLADLTARTGYSLIGQNPKKPHRPHGGGFRILPPVRLGVRADSGAVVFDRFLLGSRA
jgi:hypothetical protein